jgi:CRP-like cAMP-binding protein
MKQLQTFQRRLHNYHHLTAVNWIQEAISGATSLSAHQIARLSALHVAEQAEGDAQSGKANAKSARSTTPALALTERDWALLFGAAPPTRYARGHCMLGEGDFSTKLYRVRSGRVRMEKKDVNGFLVRTGTVEAGGMFGEFSLLGANSGHRFVVESAGDAELSAVDISHVSALFATQPKLCAKFYRIFATNLASKIASFPVPLAMSLENIGNTGNFQMYSSSQGEGKGKEAERDGEKSKNISKVDQEFRQEFQLADEYVIKGVSYRFLLITSL